MVINPQFKLQRQRSLKLGKNNSYDVDPAKKGFSKITLLNKVKGRKKLSKLRYYDYVLNDNIFLRTFVQRI